MQARLPEDLVGVQVADAGQEALVEEERLQASAAAAELGAEAPGGELGERLGAESVVEERFQLGPALEQVDPTELSRVDEMELGAIVEAEREMGVARQRGAGLAQHQVAAHLAVDDQPAVAVQPDQEVFAPPIDGLEGSAVDGREELVGRGVRQHPRPVHRARAGDAATEDAGAQPARGRLDLGQLRHRRRGQLVGRWGRCRCRGRRSGS